MMQERGYMSYSAANDFDRVMSINKYDSFQLSDFSKDFSGFVFLSSARKAMIHIYSGDPSENWFLQLIIGSLGVLMQHNAGVVFLLNILQKAKEKYEPLIDRIMEEYAVLLTSSAGCRIITDLFVFLPLEKQAQIAKSCFDYMKSSTNDEFFQLVSLIIQSSCTSYQDLAPLMSLGLYVENPKAVLVGRTIIEFLDFDAIIRFKNEILSNIEMVLACPFLSTLVISLFYCKPMANRVSIYNELEPKLKEMIDHPFQWRIVHAMLCVLPMKTKVIIARMVGGTIAGSQGSIIPSHFDVLTRFALEMIDFKSRLRIMREIQFTYQNPNFPEVTSYIDGLQKVLS